jgi:hypothetical protein
VRTGYASILVSRTRGAALLRPAAPSRFEPETRPGDFGDNMIIGNSVDATPEAPVATPEAPVAAPSRVERPIHEPAVGWRQPWAADEQDEPLVRLRRPGQEWGLFDARATRLGEPAHWEAIDDGEPDRRHGIAPTRALRSGQSRTPGERAAVPSAIEAPQATPEPTGPVEQLVVTRGLEHEYLSAVRSSTPAEHGGVDAPIIVRIGRLDVRAVQAAPAPRAEARPRRQAGPTLEERLLARDRQ